MSTLKVPYKAGDRIEITYIAGSIHGGSVTRIVDVLECGERGVLTTDKDDLRILYYWHELLNHKPSSLGAQLTS